MHNFVQGFIYCSNYFMLIVPFLLQENFLAEAEKHFDSNTEYFYSNLVAAFHAVSSTSIVKTCSGKFADEPFYSGMHMHAGFSVMFCTCALCYLVTYVLVRLTV